MTPPKGTGLPGSLGLSWAACWLCETNRLLFMLDHVAFNVACCPSLQQPRINPLSARPLCHRQFSTLSPASSPPLSARPPSETNAVRGSSRGPPVPPWRRKWSPCRVGSLSPSAHSLQRPPREWCPEGATVAGQAARLSQSPFTLRPALLTTKHQHLTAVAVVCAVSVQLAFAFAGNVWGPPN